MPGRRQTGSHPARLIHHAIGGAASPDDAAASTRGANANRVWERLGDDGLADMWSGLAGDSSAASISGAETVFAAGAAELPVDAAPGAAIAAFADGRTQQVAGAIALLAAAMLFERGSRTDDKPRTFSRWRSRAR